MRGVVEWVVEPRRKRERSDGVSETMQHGYCLRIRVVGPKKYFGKNGRSRLLRLRSSLLSFRFGVDRQGAGFVTILSTTNFENPRQGSAPKYSL